MDLSSVGKFLIIVGIVVLLVGLAFLVLGRLPFLGRLPGDFTIRRDGLTIFFPLATMILLSIILTVVL
ncbi:MAG: DUF2905 domain-containing protein, partial [Dehalococcoidia bacterium]